MKALRLATLLIAATVATTVAQAQSTEGAKPEQPRKVMPVAPKQTEKTFPVGTTWSAVSLKGKAFTGERPTFSLDQAFRGRGFGGCNSWSATVYPLRNQTFAVGPIAVTKKSCPATSASENAYLAALRSAQKWDIQGSILIVYTAAGELRFNRSL